MGLFERGKSGGIMNVIRCDEQDYLVWKWRPRGQGVNSTSRENGIRWGSSLRVKDGEVAVFVYRHNDQTMQEFIVGPYDEFLKTANLPIIANVVGLAYGREAPFQAEVYYINTANVIQLNFGVPYFDVQDPRFPDFSVPLAVRGLLTFKIKDYKEFVKVNRLRDFTLDDLKRQVREAVVRRVKAALTNILYEKNMSLVQIERNIEEINDELFPKIKQDVADFGIELNRLDISNIEPDKADLNYQQLMQATGEFAMRTVRTNQEIALETAAMEHDANLKNIAMMQQLNAENMAETMRIQRQEMQRAQQLQTEMAAYASKLQSQQANLGAFATGQQADVLKAGAGSMAQMGAVNLGDGSGGSMNPAGMMTGMAMGGAMAKQMAQMMSQMNNSMAGPNTPGSTGTTGQMPPAPPTPPTGMPTPPPLPGQGGLSTVPEYFVAVNGQQGGPFSLAQLKILADNGNLQPDTLIWKAGMPQWMQASQCAEVQPLLQAATPPTPPTPPVPPVPPTPPTPPAPPTVPTI